MASLAASGCAGDGRRTAGVRQSDHNDLRGADIWSESAALVALAPDARFGVSLRLCRFPSAGITWIWANIFLPGRHLGRSEDHWPSNSERLVIDLPQVIYEARSRAEYGRLIRHGPKASPSAVEMDFRLMLNEGAFEGYGGGDRRAHVSANFVPLSDASAILEGRTEITGRVAVDGFVDGAPLSFKAFGKWHEQQQSHARFAEPFSYLSGSCGANLQIVAIRGNGGAAGSILIDGVAHKVKNFSITPPAPKRQWKIETASGLLLFGEVQAVQTYRQPVFDDWRASAIVTGQCAARPFSGFINDWMPRNMTYKTDTPTRSQSDRDC